MKTLKKKFQIACGGQLSSLVGSLYRNPESGLFDIIPWDYDTTFGHEWNGDPHSLDSISIEGKNT